MRFSHTNFFHSCFQHSPTAPKHHKNPALFFKKNRYLCLLKRQHLKLFPLEEETKIKRKTLFMSFETTASKTIPNRTKIKNNKLKTTSVPSTTLMGRTSYWWGSSAQCAPYQHTPGTSGLPRADGTSQLGAVHHTSSIDLEQAPTAGPTHHRKRS